MVFLSILLYTTGSTDVKKDVYEKMELQRLYSVVRKALDDYNMIEEGTILQ